MKGSIPLKRFFNPGAGHSAHGLYTVHPNRPGGRTPEFIPEISASELRTNFATLPIDRTMLDVMDAAKHLDQIQIVNGLVPGNVLRALRGEHVGTIIHGS